MTKVKRIQFEETIAAPADVVWDVLLGVETYGRWTEPFAEGSYYEGSWRKGSRMKFLSPSGDGVLAEIAENRPGELLSIRHVGYVIDGVEDTESDGVRSWAPAFENYTLETVPEGTRIVIDQDVTEDFEQCMKDTWPKALGVLKGLCEEDPA